ncbi:hypothetical protein [Streptomyces sp. ME19-01-6]|uniref:NAD-dependent epimerase/dehydratase family protein n=1 Tax=Streptomyces sp. ME19-01-6 TaxID=3028686 RepID=UPI0029B8F27D|nr:hypothetical protein [Streptomyces sp. ME19-01-6]MDX3228654.1 hypothetical protein [Streptomyces sp. ME19-01-6]
MRSARPGFLDIVLDPDPDGPPTALRSMMRAWADIPADSTHHLVLEDDAQLSPGFAEHAERAAAAAPHAAIAFYTNWNARNGAMVRVGVLAGARWVEAVNEYTPTVALLLPAAVGRGFADYVREHAGSGSDDILMSHYLAAAGVPTYLTVPNIVQHGAEPSISGNDGQGQRRAICFAAPSPETDWSLRHIVEPDVVPYFELGVAQCMARAGRHSRWLRRGTEPSMRRLGLDVDLCHREFRESLPSRADAAAGPLSEVTLEEIWQAAYVAGAVSRRFDTFPDVDAQIGQWNDDPLVREALSTLAPGGLCWRYGSAELTAIQDHVTELACRAAAAGARSARPERQPPLRRSATTPTTHRFVVVGGAGTLRKFLLTELPDRGHRVVTAPSGTGSPSVSLRPLLEHADAVLHIPDPSSPAGTLQRLTEEARAVGVHRIASLVLPGLGEQPDPGPFVTTLRLGLLYGPYVTDSLVNDLVRQAAGTRPPVAVRPCLPERIQLVHVEDLADLLELFAESDTTSGSLSGSFDVCNPDSPSGAGLWDLVCRTVLRAPAPPYEDTCPAPPLLSPARTQTELGWTPSVDLVSGIKHVQHWLAWSSISD